MVKRGRKRSKRTKPARKRRRACHARPAQEGSEAEERHEQCIPQTTRSCLRGNALQRIRGGCRGTQAQQAPIIIQLELTTTI